MLESFHGGFKLKALYLLLAFALLTSCTDNLYSEFADENDDKALLESVRRYISSGNYASATTTCSYLSAEYAASAEARYVCAAAYAGTCGLNFINFANELATFNPAGDYLLQFFLSNLGVETAAQETACNTSQDLLEAIGTAAQRSTDANTLMVLLNFKKLDVAANVNADSNDDGAVDGGYDSCAVSDTVATTFGSALWELKESAGYTTIPGASDISTAITAACTALNGVDPNLNFCNAPDADTFTTDQLRGVRSMIREGANNFGLADCGANPVVACVCP